MSRPKDFTVKERCLVCQGEGWLPEPLEPARSKPCQYCAQSGWIEVQGPAPAPASPGPGPKKAPTSGPRPA